MLLLIKLVDAFTVCLILLTGGISLYTGHYATLILCIVSALLLVRCYRLNILLTKTELFKSGYKKGYVDALCSNVDNMKGGWANIESVKTSMKELIRKRYEGGIK